MDYAACNVVYVDRTAREDKLVKREDVLPAESTDNHLNHAEEPTPIPTAVDGNVKSLLGTFSEGQYPSHSPLTTHN
jgi:3',5'-cyclic-nucleotide phosphodiesterase